jgi:hypothetical protein
MKFRFSEDFVIDTDEEPWCREGLRITMLGGPGSGKSWNNSLLAEQFLKQGGTVVIFQPRDEYYTLKEKFDILSVGGVHAKDMEFALTSPHIYARAVVEDGISMSFYTSGVEDEEKLVDFVSRFIRYLMRYQEKHKRPLMVILEDAEDYIPKSASGHIAPPWVYNRMIRRFKDLYTQGRKLNIIGVASSQRPQQLNFTVRQLANLVFYGGFSPQDIAYIQRECLRPYKEKGIEVDANQLLDLPLGRWLVITGKQAQFITVTEPRLTKHGAETPKLTYVAPRTREAKSMIDQLAKTILEALRKEEAEKSELEKAKRKIRELTKKLEVAEKKAEIKLSVKEMLEAGVSESDLAEKLAKAETERRSLRGLVTDLKRELSDAKAKLEQATRDLEVFRELQDVLRKIVPMEQIVPSEGAEISLTQEVPQVIVKVSKPVVELDEKTWQGRLVSLVASGFFDASRKLGDVQRELDRIFSMKGRPSTISRELAALCPMRILERKQESGSWSYSVLPGAKERIKVKEVSA